MLEEHGGLLVSAVLDGAGPRLEELILRATDPDVDPPDRVGGPTSSGASTTSRTS